MFKSQIETLEIIKKYEPGKITFWTGAGIDFPAPTCLPLGSQLTEFFIKFACGNDLGSAILREWKKRQNWLNFLPFEKQQSGVPRLETIVESIREIEQNLSENYSIISGFASFNEPHPNLSHYILAEFLNNGSNIITTNFDNCVPKAYNEIYRNEAIIDLSPQKDGSGLYVYESSNPKAGKIYHVHGVASHYPDLGASLQKIKNGLPLPFMELLRKWYSEGHCQIYLGYGGGDSLDVNLFFLNEKPSISEGIYVRHESNSNGENKPSKISKNEKTILRPFSKKTICCCNTSDILEKSAACSLGKKEIRKTATENIQPFDWEKSFVNASKPFPADLQIMATAKLLYELGIEVNLIFHDDAWESGVCNLSYVTNNYDKRVITDAYRTTGNPEKIKQYGKFVYTPEELSAIMREHSDSLEGFISPAEAREKIKIALLKGEEIPWDYSNSFNRRTEKLVRIWIHPLKKFSRNEFSEAEIMIECLQQITEAGYKNVVQINQVNTAFRALGMLQMIFKKDYENGIKNINNAFSNYLDTSSFRGVYTTTLYSAAVSGSIGIYRIKPALFLRGLHHLILAGILLFFGKINSPSLKFRGKSIRQSDQF